MFELLFYSGIVCTDAADIISRVRANDSVSELVQIEVIETLKESTPECNWDAND